MAVRVAFVAFDQGVGGVVMNGFKVFGFDDIPFNTGFSIQTGSDIAHHVFDEFRIVVSAFGDEFFVRTLEQAKQFARRFFFDQAHNVFDPHKFGGAHGDGDVGALVVRATFRNFLRARAKAGHRDNDF